MSQTTFNPDQVLKGLKDFQRLTVDYVFHRLYCDAHPARRFLVADEVGLGKTLVARGVVAKAIQHLQEQGENRIDVVYICSNADIARQNISRLNLKIDGVQEFNLPTRITLLPLFLPKLNQQGVNFISFTPGTSFDLKSSTGTMQERALLYWLLKFAWKWRRRRHIGVFHLLRDYAALKSFRYTVDATPRDIGTGTGKIDRHLAEAFRDRLAIEAAQRKCTPEAKP